MGLLSLASLKSKQDLVGRHDKVWGTIPCLEKDHSIINLFFTNLRSTLIFTLLPLGSTTFRSIEPASMSGGVSSVTGSGGAGAMVSRLLQ